jgi:hypothetical protein
VPILVPAAFSTQSHLVGRLTVERAVGTLTVSGPFQDMGG